MWEMLKGSPIVARLLSLSKSSAATGETKSKFIRIVTILSKDTAPEAPPVEVPRRSRYEDINIRLYNNGEETRPYVSDPMSNQRSRYNERQPDAYNNPEPRRSSQMKTLGREGLRKVGYDAIHPGSRGRPTDYSRMEEEKGYQPYDRPRREERPMESQSAKMQKSIFDKEKGFDQAYDFPLDGGARREPMVKIPFNDNLLHDYCCMLDKENNRDINIFAIQSLEPLIKDCARIIVNDPEMIL